MSCSTVEARRANASGSEFPPYRSGFGNLCEVSFDARSLYDIAPLRWVAQGCTTLGRRGDVCSHAVERGGLVGIGFCVTGAIRFTALHLSPTFDERPLVSPGLECSVLGGAGEFVFVHVLVAILHAFDELTVADCMIAIVVENLGSDAEFHLVPSDVALNSYTSDLFD